MQESHQEDKEAKLVVATAGAKLFELCGNHLSDDARQPWEKIIKAQVMQAPWEDVFGIPHTETLTKNWSSFCKWVMFHVQPCFVLMWEIPPSITS